MTTVEHPRAHLPVRARLSPRKVKDLVEVGQRWQHADGTVWCVCNHWRSDHQVHIARSEPCGRQHSRTPRYFELGRDYRLLEDR